MGNMKTQSYVGTLVCNQEQFDALEKAKAKFKLVRTIGTYDLTYLLVFNDKAKYDAAIKSIAKIAL